MVESRGDDKALRYCNGVNDSNDTHGVPDTRGVHDSTVYKRGALVGVLYCGITIVSGPQNGY